MPGLRSLVARRRSSLASTPPGSPHSRPATPCPPSPPPPPDYAASTAPLTPQGTADPPCLMPGGPTNAGDHSLQEGKEDQQAHLEPLPAQEYQPGEEADPGVNTSPGVEAGPGEEISPGVEADAGVESGPVVEADLQQTGHHEAVQGQEETPGCGLEREATNNTENSTPLKNEETVAPGLPVSEENCNPGAVSELSSPRDDAYKEETSVSDRDRNLGESESGHSENMCKGEMPIDDQGRNYESEIAVNENTHVTGEGIQEGDFGGEITQETSAREEHPHQNPSAIEGETIQNNEINFENQCSSVTDSTRQHVDGVGGSGHVSEEDAGSHSVAEEEANQNTWSSEFLDVVESRRLDNENVCSEPQDTISQRDGEKSSAEGVEDHTSTQMVENSGCQQTSEGIEPTGNDKESTRRENLDNVEMKESAEENEGALPCENQDTGKKSYCIAHPERTESTGADESMEYKDNTGESERELKNAVNKDGQISEGGVEMKSGDRENEMELEKWPESNHSAEKATSDVKTEPESYEGGFGASEHCANEPIDNKGDNASCVGDVESQGTNGEQVKSLENKDSEEVGFYPYKELESDDNFVLVGEEKQIEGETSSYMGHSGQSTDSPLARETSDFQGTYLESQNFDAEEDPLSLKNSDQYGEPEDEDPLSLTDVNYEEFYSGELNEELEDLERERRGENSDTGSQIITCFEDTSKSQSTDGSDYLPESKTDPLSLDKSENESGESYTIPRDLLGDGGSSITEDQALMEFGEKCPNQSDAGDINDPSSVKTDGNNESEIKNEAVDEGEAGSPSSRKDDVSKDGNSANNKRPYPFTASPKLKKGPGRCSELSATEIESTLASRGVTIVRRMVDSKESAGSNRSNPDASPGSQNDGVGKSGIVLTSSNSRGCSNTRQNARQSARLLTLYKTQGRPSMREYGPTSPSANQQRPGISGVGKDLYKAINAPGTVMHPGPKTPQPHSNMKGPLQFNTRGVSIQFNPKGASPNLNVRGSSIYSKTRGPNIYANKGNMQLNPKGMNVQASPRMFSASPRMRGPSLQSMRGANLQNSPRAPAGMTSQRGVGRPMRYSSPRGALRPSFPGMTPRMRGMNPQTLKAGVNQQLQQNPSACTPQSKTMMGLPGSKPGAGSLHSTASNRSMKLSPHSHVPGMNTDFKQGDISQVNLPGLSPQQQRPEGMLSPQNRSAEVSPHSRTGQMSQPIGTGIYAQSKFTDSSLGLSPQGMMMDQSKAGIPISSPGAGQLRPSMGTGHISVPASSQHLTQMSLMDYSTQSGTGVGLPPHSSASNRHLQAQNSVPGMMPQGSVTPQLNLSAGLSPLATSESFATNVTSEGFSSLSHSEYLGRSTTETFPPYSTLSDFPPHSSAATDYTASLGTGDFTMQSNTGGFPAQTNLVGFPPQTNPCVYSQHASTGGFTTGNVSHSTTENFASHPSCGSFTPTAVNTAGYPPHSTAQLYNTPTNTDILGYSASRDFMMNAAYSGTNQLSQDMSASTGHRDLQLNPSTRDYSLQNPTTGIPLTSNPGNASLSTIVGDQYSQPAYDPLGLSTYQQDALHTRTNPNEVPLLPDLRDSSLRHTFRDSSLPLYGNFRDPAQDNLRTPQMQNSYRDMPLNSSMSTVQPHADARTQNLQTNYKEQPVSSAYREQEIIANYLESSVLNYRDQGDMGACQEQTNPAYRPASSHTSPSEQILPSFSNPGSHASPQDQPMTNYSDGASPRDHVLPPQASAGQMTPGESVLPGFQDTVNNSTANQDLSGFQDSMNYTGFRDAGNYNIGYEKPGSNTSDYASSTSSRHSDVPQGGRSNAYKDPQIVPGYRLTDTQGNLKYKDDMGQGSENTVLPSFTESFDSTSPNDMNRKDNVALSHYKPMSEYGSLKGSPASVSTEGTSATSPFVNHHTGDMSPLTNDYSLSYGREASNYQNKRVYSGHPHDSYSPAQYSDDGGGGGIGHLGKAASNSYASVNEQFFHDASHLHTTMTTSHGGSKNSIAKSDVTAMSQPVVSDSQVPSDVSNEQGPSGTSKVESTPENPALPDTDGQAGSASPSYQCHGDKGPYSDASNPSLGFHIDRKKEPGKQTADENSDGVSDQPFLGNESLSPNSKGGVANKFPSVSSPTKSDSNSSPSTQERIVIKMKLLPANSTGGKHRETAESASTNDPSTNNKSSIKYTRWTIDSIINGSEDDSGTGKEEESKIVPVAKDEDADTSANIRKGSKQRTSDSGSDVKDSNLDTNKNLMKKSLKITIPNPLRARISSDDDKEMAKVKDEKKEKDNKDLKTEDIKLKTEDIKLKTEDIKQEKVEDSKEDIAVISKRKRREARIRAVLAQSGRKNTRSRGIRYPSPAPRSPSPTPSLDSCSSTSTVSRVSYESRIDSKSSDSSIYTFQSENEEPQEQDVKKCSIVIKRIYTDNTYSCYSSSLCDDNNGENIEEEEVKEISKPRPKRRAAVEASERCHKTLRPLDYNTPKLAKITPVEKGKEVLSAHTPFINLLVENSAPNGPLRDKSSLKKGASENISQCSVLLYDVFMDSRLNKLSCPGCSRHYDSSDSIQVNISKATISLLCCRCQWLVVKDVRPHEIISSLAPS